MAEIGDDGLLRSVPQTAHAVFIAAAAVGGARLPGGVGRITGTPISGAMTGGFTFPGVDAYIQSIEGTIIVAAVMADPYRRGSRRDTRSATLDRGDGRGPPDLSPKRTDTRSRERPRKRP